MSEQTTTPTIVGVQGDRELKRNVRGQVVSYEIPSPDSVPPGTALPNYSKVYIEGQEGTGTTPERFSLTRVLEGLDSSISELRFNSINVRSNVNVRTSIAGTIAGDQVITSGFNPAGVTTPNLPSLPSTGQASAGSAGTTGGLINGGGDGSPIGVGGYDSYGFNADSFGPGLNFNINQL